MGISSEIHRIIGIRADCMLNQAQTPHRLHCPLDGVTYLVGVNRTRLLNRAEESDPN
jgi:hypothetical protein